MPLTRVCTAAVIWKGNAEFSVVLRDKVPDLSFSTACLPFSEHVLCSLAQDHFVLHATGQHISERLAHITKAVMQLQLVTSIAVFVQTCKQAHAQDGCQRSSS